MNTINIHKGLKGNIVWEGKWKLQNLRKWYFRDEKYNICKKFPEWLNSKWDVAEEISELEYTDIEIKENESHSERKD